MTFRDENIALEIIRGLLRCHIDGKLVASFPALIALRELAECSRSRFTESEAIKVLARMKTEEKMILQHSLHF